MKQVQEFRETHDGFVNKLLSTDRRTKRMLADQNRGQLSQGEMMNLPLLYTQPIQQLDPSKSTFGTFNVMGITPMG